MKKQNKYSVIAVGKESGVSGTLLVELDDATWTYDDDHEFFSDYRRSLSTAYYWRSIDGAKLQVTAHSYDTECFSSGS